MTGWLLILTIPWHAITSAGPFATEAACMAAGNAWVKQHTAVGMPVTDRPSVGALCVRQN